METILEYVKDLVGRGDSIECVTAFISGWYDAEEILEPGKTYTAAEMKELFDLLYDVSIRNISRH